VSTTPRIPVPDAARDGEGVVAMGPVLAALVPDLAALRAAYFEVLAAVVAREPAVHELNRLATAETTGCRYCRNVRREDARAAGVDEDAVARVRAGGSAAFDGRDAVALRLGERLRGLPAGAGDGAAPELGELGEELGTAVVAAVARAVADGKAIVALGLEPEAMPVRVV
jgi:AhpD family alkylhydroperoxidase